MIIKKMGKVVKGIGGLYEVLPHGESDTIYCRAKGILKRDEAKVMIGDDVNVVIDDATPDSVVISEVIPRKNELIRPPVSNIDYLFIAFAAAKPAPVLETVDKLTAIAYHGGITPVIIVTKSDVSPESARKYADIYIKAGIETFIASSKSGDGIKEILDYISKNVRCGATAAFAGASGVGKSTLMNALFPGLALSTGEISKKIERGRHTTRHVEIFDIGDGGFLADTPGFSLIDFARFEFFGINELLPAFPDIARHGGCCRYADCAHVGEGTGECSVARAAQAGEISAERLESYRSLYRVLKNKTEY